MSDAEAVYLFLVLVLGMAVIVAAFIAALMLIYVWYKKIKAGK